MREYQLISAEPTRGLLGAGPATKTPFDLPIIIPPFFPLLIERIPQEYHLNELGGGGFAGGFAARRTPHLPLLVEKILGKAPFGSDNSW
jgi:hypothetical protein